MKYNKCSICTVQCMYFTPPWWHWWITTSGVWYVLYNTCILLYLLTLMNYNKWSMTCTVQYMYLTIPVDIEELQQVEDDMYCTIHVSYSTWWHWWITTSGGWYVLYNTWILLYLLTLMNYNKWSMICTVQYMYLTLPVDIDELQQVEYDIRYCTIHVSYSTCWHWWITTSGVWYVLYNTWMLLYLLTLMNYKYAIGPVSLVRWRQEFTINLQFISLPPPPNMACGHYDIQIFSLW